MSESTVFVGMDVHRDWVSLATLRGSARECDDVRTVPYDVAKLKRFFERLREPGVAVHACYEASGMGFTLFRALREMGVACMVAAPSLIPQRPGDHCKTDKRDAAKLAHFLRAGELVAVVVPDEAHERVRALTRCRETFSREARSSRHHVVKFLAVQGVVFRDGRQWTQAHWRWLRAVRLEGPAQRAFDAYLALLDFKLSRLAEIDKELEALAPNVPFAGAVARVRCLRGFDTVGAMTVAAEICDARRFESPRHLMAFFGLTVSERSTGGPAAKQRMGGITKAGNSRCRRLLVEAAWHYRHPPRTSRALAKRRDGQPADVVAHAERAQHRLHRRFHRLSERMIPARAAVAVARELTGFLWAVMRGEPALLLARPR